MAVTPNVVYKKVSVLNGIDKIPPRLEFKAGVPVAQLSEAITTDVF